MCKKHTALSVGGRLHKPLISNSNVTKFLIILLFFMAVSNFILAIFSKHLLWRDLYYLQKFLSVRMGRSMFYEIKCVEMSMKSIKTRVFFSFFEFCLLLVRIDSKNQTAQNSMHLQFIIFLTFFSSFKNKKLYKNKLKV